MKKIILLLLLMIPIVHATIDFTIKPAIDDGNIASVINPTASLNTTIDRGFLFLPALYYPGAGGPAIGPKKAATLYYDVLVNVIKDKYQDHEIVQAELIIINKGHQPDRDGRLESYLVDPNGQVWRNKTQEFELIPPSCQYGGTINRYFDLCEYDNGSSYEPFRYYLIRNMTLPFNATLGEWDFIVEYETRIQPKIKASDYFDVYAPIKNLWLIVILVVIIAYMLWKQHQTNKLMRGYSR